MGAAPASVEPVPSRRDPSSHVRLTEPQATALSAFFIAKRKLMDGDDNGAKNMVIAETIGLSKSCVQAALKGWPVTLEARNALVALSSGTLDGNKPEPGPERAAALDGVQAVSDDPETASPSSRAPVAKHPMPASAAHRYAMPDKVTVTIGTHVGVTTSWHVAKEVTLFELYELLSEHQRGEKKGSCIALGAFGMTEVEDKKTRSKTLEHRLFAEAMETLSCLSYDLDEGELTFEEIVESLEKNGLGGVVCTTYNHMLEKKGKTCARFRVVIPLAKPWSRADHRGLATATVAWKRAYRATAAMLGFNYDKACENLNRFFYLPRRPEAGPQPLSRVIEGEPCDPWASDPLPVYADIDASDAAHADPTDARDADTADMDLLDEIMAMLPNDGQFPDYEDFRNIVFAVKGAYAEDPARGLDAVEKWADRWPGAQKPGFVEHVWDSVQKPILGASYVLKMVKKHCGEAGASMNARHHFGPTDKDVFIEKLSEQIGSGIERASIREVFKDFDVTAKISEAAKVDCSKSEAVLDETERAVAELNERHAVVRNGGKTMLLTEDRDADGRVVASDFGDELSFHRWYANRKLLIGGRHISVSKHWMEHPSRRGYVKVDFNPRGAPDTVYNLWHGFAVEPDPHASCELLLWHLENIVCRGDSELFKWLIGWFAHLIQRPWEKPGTAVVLQGGKGDGKSIVGETIGALFPAYHVKLARPDHLTGRFNAHLKQALLVQAEEAFWAGDKRADGVIKDLITAPTIRIEQKGIDTYEVPSCTRVLMTSNSNWIVPATPGERRYAVFELSGAKRQDTAYFSALAAERDRKGGLGALMHHLMQVDLRAVDVREAPKTEAGRDQIMEGLESHEAFWRQCLDAGRIDHFNDWQPEIAKPDLIDAYRQYARKEHVQYPAKDNAFWKAIKRMAPGLLEVRESQGVRRRMLRLGSLDDRRTEFDKFIGQKVDWHDNPS
ncbi:MAG: primase-helicase family protein [Methylocella sp.]